MIDRNEEKFTLVFAAQAGCVNRLDKIDDRLHGIDIRIENIASNIKRCVSFDIIHQEIQVREAWQAGLIANINKLSEHIKKIEDQDIQGFSWQKGQIESLHERIKRLEDGDESKILSRFGYLANSIHLTREENVRLKEKIDILLDTVNRKTMNIEALEQELKDETECHKCDVKNYEFRIKEMQQIIADRNKEIHDLKNPQVNQNNKIAVHVGGGQGIGANNCT